VPTGLVRVEFSRGRAAVTDDLL